MSRIFSSVLLVLLFLFAARSASTTVDSTPADVSAPTFEAILIEWSEGSFGSEAAAASLLQFVAPRSGFRAPNTRRREAKIVRKLAQGAPGTYVPVIRLYSTAHLLAVRSGQEKAAGYLRLESTRLVDEYMSRAQSSEGWRIGSRFLVSLAASLRDTRNVSSSLSLFERALDAEPGNPHALFAVAAIREKFGQYAVASQLLERLVVQASIPEAELRLALCRARSGKSEAAEKSLRLLATGSGPAWVRAIAYQEWSRLRMSQGDPGAALRIAKEGHEELPNDESLAVLVAFMSGPRDPRSRHLGRRLTSRPTGSGQTARGLYNLWPAGIGIVENEERLAEEVRARMPLLVDALRSLEIMPEGQSKRTP